MSNETGIHDDQGQQNEESRENDPAGKPDELFQSVYNELRNLARLKVSNEPINSSLSATSLVHEVFLRLSSDAGRMSRFRNRAHLFATAAEVMRWILVDRARARKQLKRGGSLERVPLSESQILAPASDDLVLAVNEVLPKLQAVDPESADLVKMRFFSGFSFQQIADATGVSYRTISRRWAYAKAWLKEELKTDFSNDS
ncbi:MAG: ECF-type sigma factor [Verrucomicrobiota bacterium]